MRKLFGSRQKGWGEAINTFKAAEAAAVRGPNGAARYDTDILSSKAAKPQSPAQHQATIKAGQASAAKRRGGLLG